MEPRLTALGAYVYAGGFALGVKKHFDIVAHFEEGTFGVETVKRNFPHLENSIYTDPATWPAERFRGQVDFVYSNPPCAPWSVAGKAMDGQRGLRDDDPRVQCVYNTFNLLREVSPRVWVWESVSRTAKAGRDLIDRLAAEAADMGYSCSIVLHDGQDCGVPQRRRRAFVVFHDVEIDWRRPDAPRRVVGDVMRDVDFDPEKDTARFTNFIREIAPHVGQWQSARDTYNRLHGVREGEKHPSGRWPGRPSFQMRRIGWDGVSYTMTGGAHLIHPEEDRWLSVPECAAICGFPRDYQFVGPLGDRYKQVARGVMPPTAEWLAGEVHRAIVADARVTAPETRVVDFLKR